MTDELILSPFDREIVGWQGQIILRRNPRHANDCATAIRRRKQPGWSRFVCGFQVEEDASFTGSQRGWE